MINKILNSNSLKLEWHCIKKFWKTFRSWKEDKARIILVRTKQRKKKIKNKKSNRRHDFDFRVEDERSINENCECQVPSGGSLPTIINILQCVLVCSWWDQTQTGRPGIGKWIAGMILRELCHVVCLHLNLLPCSTL